jgi:multiple sugar transport system ATP-binding protein
MAINVENLGHRYGSFVACWDINFHVDDTKILVLLGPSGCGKTTVLRCIAGLIKPTTGSISIAEREVTNMLPRDRQIAFVFQNIALFPHMTIKRNISFGLDMAKNLTKEEIDRRIEHVAAILQLKDHLDKKPSQMSGGQQQRAALGRAMVMEPSAFLLDEPFANLDANLKVEMRTEIHKLQRKLKKAMVFVTHDQEEAMVLGDTILLMKDGTIQQAGTPDEIYNDPVNVFVATFIGQPNTNLVEGKLLIKDNRCLLDQGQFTLSFEAAQFKQSLAGHDRLLVGIRPENVRINASNPHSCTLSDSAGVCKARVHLLEPLGSRVVIYSALDDFEFRSVVLPEEARGISEGQEVEISFDIERAWFFSTKGERIH